MTRNYAPTTDTDGDNEVLYTAQLRDGIQIKLSLYKKNKRHYMQLRRVGQSAISLPMTSFKGLQKAIQDISENFDETIPDSE